MSSIRHFAVINVQRKERIDTTFRNVAGDSRNVDYFQPGSRPQAGNRFMARARFIG
jgi:hypothetical protein